MPLCHPPSEHYPVAKSPTTGKWIWQYSWEKLHNTKEQEHKKRQKHLFGVEAEDIPQDKNALNVNFSSFHSSLHSLLLLENGMNKARCEQTRTKIQYTGNEQQTNCIKINKKRERDFRQRGRRRRINSSEEAKKWLGENDKILPSHFSFARKK